MFKIRGFYFATMIFLYVGYAGIEPVYSQKREFTIHIINPQENKSMYPDPVYKGLNRFTFRLYNEINAGSQNVFLSPYSISSALALAYLGSAKNTQAQFVSLFRWDPDLLKFGSSFKLLNEQISQSSTGEPSAFSSANSIWVDKKFSLRDDYVTTARSYLNSSIEKTSFKEEPDNSRLAINKWVEDKTNNRIKDFISPGVIKSSTKVVLVNAVYYFAKWKKEFNSKKTEDADFYVSPNKKISVPFMNDYENSYHYYQDNNIKAIEIPYKDDQFSAIFILPLENGGFLKAWDYMNIDSFENIIKFMNREKVDVSIPKFTIESSFSLTKALRNLGLTDAFSPAADFSGMTGDKSLYFDEAIHKTFIQVNEEGTEAAAATGVFMRITSVNPALIKKFNADHPFIFIIKENKTQTILFIGQVFNPSK